MGRVRPRRIGRWARRGWTEPTRTYLNTGTLSQVRAASLGECRKLGATTELGNGRGARDSASTIPSGASSVSNSESWEPSAQLLLREFKLRFGWSERGGPRFDAWQFQFAPFPTHIVDPAVARVRRCSANSRFTRLLNVAPQYSYLLAVGRRKHGLIANTEVPR